jgi:CDP-6-deoxy-D-xylo-4-hexulose-3-dehydrase
MKTVEEQIQELIENIGKEHSVLRYVYNNGSKFVPGVSPVYYSGPYWDNQEITSAIKTLLTGSWIAAGDDVRKFEIEFGRKFNSNHCLMVNSGSSANLVMITSVKKHLNWNDGDEIITSVVGFPTTVAPITQNNLIPVFVDIEMDSLNFDLDLIESKITDKTKAIFLSPVLGNPPDMEKLVDICSRNNIILLLDDCDSLGTKWNDIDISEYAFASTTSFYASHIISTGHGGMIFSNNKELMELCRSFSSWGRACTSCIAAGNLLPNGACGHRFDTWLSPGYDGVIDHKYVFENVGYNLQPLDMQGSIGLVQLKKFDEIHTKRISNKERIAKCILENLDVHVPTNLPEAETSWFGVPFVCKSREQKEKLVVYFEERKVQTRHYFAGNLLLHPGYKHLGNWEEYPEANKVLSHVFFIGCTPQYTEDILQYIEKVIREYK